MQNKQLESGRQADAGTLVSPKLCIENVDNAFGKVDELLDRWNKRLSINNLAFAKRYIEGEMHLVLVFVALPTAIENGSAPQYQAIVQRVLCDGTGVEGGHDAKCGHGKVRRKTIPMNGFGRECVDHGRERNSDWHQHAVFVDNVDLVQTPQGICPSFIRLEAFDNCDSFRVSSSKIFPATIREGFEGFTYWEVGIVDSILASDSARNHYLNGKMVEGGSQIVDYVAHNSRPIVGNGFMFDKLMDHLLGSRIFLFEDSIGLAFQKVSNIGLQLKKVLLGPVDLYARAYQ